ncbi:translation initiation factor IF-2 [Spiroplasma endosymbiont of Aspidapion aeneum]|uniref:translation initiation factor IF-2 n=1 Tax=Spiroplasma endosymbiont of Aspidapion aeneum TaxID=3066276 RepID=UPI00313AE3BC
MAQQNKKNNINNKKNVGGQKNNNNKNVQKQQKKHINAHIKKSLNETIETGLVNGIFVYTSELSIKDFAQKINKNAKDIIKHFFNNGIMLTLNNILSEEQMGELCLEFGYDFQKEVSVTKENIFDTLMLNEDDSNWEKRPPVVTIVGHVDHGKTTLLDALRDSNVIDTEHGGITQHIGAYQIESKGGKITFLDTPGHEAFTEMRARGTNITDIVVLVVAADDGVKPQTEESIDHAKAANTNIITFINKTDKPHAKTENVKSELMNFGIVAEEYGGDIPFVEGSAKTKIGLDKLIETINIVAEINEYKANHKGAARGVVIESHLDKRRGPIATILVQHGVLRKKDLMVAGGTYGVVKELENEHGHRLTEIYPSQPVVVMGLNETPMPGDKFLIVGDEKTAREIAKAQKLKIQNLLNNKKSSFSLENIKEQIDAGELKSINIILKADAQGSVEATRNSLLKINIEGVKINILRATVGAISLSDITLAQASNGIIYGFNVRPTGEVRKKADEEKVDIRLHTIIYKILEEIEDAATGMLDPIFEEVITGQAEVRAIFKHSQVGTIAGCYVINGSIYRGSSVRIIRDGIVVYSGEISSLKHIKDEIKEAKEGHECGVTIKNFNDIKEGDIIEGYKNQEVK